MSSSAASQVVGLVPARGGSKGIPRKNSRPLAGRTLLDYAADAARASGVIDRLILSTDDDEISRIGINLGYEVPFLRPPGLADDSAPMVDVVRHALAHISDLGDEAIVVLLQPTAPLRKPEHVRAAVRLLREEKCDSVVSVVELPRHMSPDYVLSIHDGRLQPFGSTWPIATRRQDARPAYFRDGTVYAFWKRTLAEFGNIYGPVCLPIVLSESEALTLDTESDWQRAEQTLGRRPRSTVRSPVRDAHSRRPPT